MATVFVQLASGQKQFFDLFVTLRSHVVLPSLSSRRNHARTIVQSLSTVRFDTSSTSATSATAHWFPLQLASVGCIEMPMGALFSRSRCSRSSGKSQKQLTGVPHCQWRPSRPTSRSGLLWSIAGIYVSDFLEYRVVVAYNHFGNYPVRELWACGIIGNHQKPKRFSGLSRCRKQ